MERATRGGRQQVFHIEDVIEKSQDRLRGVGREALGVDAAAAAHNPTEPSPPSPTQAIVTAAAAPSDPSAAGNSGVLPAHDAPASTRAGASLSSVTDEDRRLAARRLAAVEAWEHYARTAGGGRAAEEVATEFGTIWNASLEQHNGVEVSKTTLYRWRSSYRQAGIAGLLDGRAVAAATLVRQKQIPDPLWGAFKRYWLGRNQLSVQVAYELALAQCGGPVRDAWAREYPVTLFRRRVHELPQAVVVLARDGAKAYADKCEQPIFRDYTSLFANQLWCSDHRQLDLWVWDPVSRKPYRAWITVWQDVRSRKIVSWLMEHTSANSNRVLCSWADAVLAHGLPQAVLIDNGKDYRCKMFAGGRVRDTVERITVDEEEVTPILGELEVEAHYANPYNARSKPIERWFRTVCERFDKLWESYCSNEPNSQKKPELCKQLLADSPERLPRIEVARDAFGSFVEWFNAKWRHTGDGMGGRTPDEVFLAHRHVHRLVSEERLKLCLMPSEILTVHRGCVQLKVGGLGRWYSDAQGVLAQMPAKTRVKARFNPRSPQTIYLFDEEGRELCTASEQSGVDWFDHEMAKVAVTRQKRLRRQVKLGIEAEMALIEHPDQLDAVRQQQIGYEAAHQAESLEATGTDDRRARTKLTTRPRPLRPTLRVVGDGLPITVSGPSEGRGAVDLNTGFPATEKGRLPVSGPSPTTPCEPGGGPGGAGGSVDGATGNGDPSPDPPPRSWVDEILNECARPDRDQVEEDEVEDWKTGLLGDR